MALAAGRSPTSLSDTAVFHEKTPVWRRGGSLSRRRNISVPELNNKIEPNTKATYQDRFADSPTIPGRPPLRKVASEMIHHERSSSAPGSWRDCPFGDAMLSGVTQPKINGSPLSVFTQWATVPHEGAASFNPTRPLSPIFSPVESTTPTTAVPRSPKSPKSPPEVPPKVPPKNPATESGSPLPKVLLKPKPSKTWLRSSPSKSNLKTTQETTPSTPSPPKVTMLATSPAKVIARAMSPPKLTMLATSPPTSASSSPTSKAEGRSSPRQAPSPSGTVSSDTSVMERGRPMKRSIKKQKSLPFLAKAVEIEPSVPSLPTGLRPMEAVLILDDSEMNRLCSQAAGQAEQFEVLGAKHVTDLSRELRALDERCEYLRKTYKSLRAGRQKLHSRMISYLKSESLIFSRDRLLKQQEALIELDRSIDDWFVKLERAENRRLRLRQKLLEHVAAAMALSPAHKPAQKLVHHTATPPRSPVKLESPRPLRVDRKEVESIKIYADNQVLNLFNDIEQAVTKMCEAC